MKATFLFCLFLMMDSIYAACTSSCTSCLDDRCFACTSGLYLNKGTCTSCPAHCTTCDSNGCLNCEPGYDASKGGCVQSCNCDNRCTFKMPAFTPGIDKDDQCVFGISVKPDACRCGTKSCPYGYISCKWELDSNGRATSYCSLTSFFRGNGTATISTSGHTSIEDNGGRPCDHVQRTFNKVASYWPVNTHRCSITPPPKTIGKKGCSSCNNMCQYDFATYIPGPDNSYDLEGKCDCKDRTCPKISTYCQMYEDKATCYINIPRSQYKRADQNWDYVGYQSISGWRQLENDKDPAPFFAAAYADAVAAFPYAAPSCA